MLSFFTIEIIDLTREFTLPETCASLEMRIICKIEFNTFHVDIPFLYPLNRGDGDRNGHLAFKWVKFISEKYVNCREVITSHCRQHLNAGGYYPL